MSSFPGPATGPHQATSAGAPETAADRGVEPAADLGPTVLVVTGIMAAGKSTVAQLLAERLPCAVHVRGDAFRRMIVSGREDMTPEPSPEALRQLRLRYQLAAHTADAYAAAGFTAIVQDILMGADLSRFLALLTAPAVYLVVLVPDASVVEQREVGRRKRGYGQFTPRDLDVELRRTTPRFGLWLDTSALSAPATVEHILARRADARLSPTVREKLVDELTGRSG